MENFLVVIFRGSGLPSSWLIGSAMLLLLLLTKFFFHDSEFRILDSSWDIEDLICAIAVGGAAALSPGDPLPQIS
jgi:hypothetical protein